MKPKRRKHASLKKVRRKATKKKQVQKRKKANRTKNKSRKKVKRNRNQGSKEQVTRNKVEQKLTEQVGSVVDARQETLKRAEREFSAKIQGIVNEYAQTTAAAECENLLSGVKKCFTMPEYSPVDDDAVFSWKEANLAFDTERDMKLKVLQEVNVFYENWKEAIGLYNFPKEIRDLKKKFEQMLQTE